LLSINYTVYIQAMCEELSKKAADLTYENENLRRVSKLFDLRFHRVNLRDRCYS